MTAHPPRIFDRATYRVRRDRAAKLDRDAFLAGDAAENVAVRIGAMNRRFVRALDLNSRRRVFPVLNPNADHWIRLSYPADQPQILADEEALPFADNSFDLVTSILSLHAVNDLPGALVQIRRMLMPDGLFIAAMFAGETLKELKFAFAAAEADLAGGTTPRVAPFADVRDLGALLQRAGFALPVADVERTRIRYRDLPRLFGDLRALGETNVLTGRCTSLSPRRLFGAVAAEYAARYSDPDGRLTATFEIAFLTGWSPHPSQQQPIQPGSARTRLAEALGTSELPAGDKPTL